MGRRELIIALGFTIAWPFAADGRTDVRALRSQILVMQAESIADKLSQFIKENKDQVGWTVQLSNMTFQPAARSIEERRFDALRLLRQAPAITEVILLDTEGKELERSSRLAMDVVGSGIDYSKEAKFTETVAKKIYYGPVYIGRESKPYMTLGLAGRLPEAGVTVVELNLSRMWEIVRQTKVGDRGIAYVVNAESRVIAHTDVAVAKSMQDLSALAHVQEARMTNSTGSARTIRDANDHEVLAAHARVDGPGWLVFVEMPIGEWAED
jgi:hypothetical protein